MTITLVVIGYLACSFVAWGLTLGFYTREFPFFSNIGFAALMAVTGPLGVLTAIIGSLADGGLAWRVIPMTKDERFSEHHKRWPLLDDSFDGGRR